MISEIQVVGKLIWRYLYDGDWDNFMFWDIYPCIECVVVNSGKANADAKISSENETHTASVKLRFMDTILKAQEKICNLKVLV